MRNFGGIAAKYAAKETAEVVLLSVPYDGTSTYGKGADKGFDAMLDAAENMELYDIETNSEVYKEGIFIAPAVTEASSPEAMCKAVKNTVQNYLKEGKFVTLFGGEHSVSIGAIAAFKDQFSDLSVLQIDAHSDLRPSYNGSACNHACAVHEASKTTNLVQVGIRSMDRIELPYVKQENFFTMYKIRKQVNWIAEVVEKLGKNVYITIDLDAFDPSIMPATGTPEPGGLFWYETIGLLKEVMKAKNVVGFDIVELAPIEGATAPDFMAAKLYYKLISYKFNV